jgi:hypothetical protein
MNEEVFSVISKQTVGNWKMYQTKAESAVFNTADLIHTAHLKLKSDN